MTIDDPILNRQSESKPEPESDSEYEVEDLIRRAAGHAAKAEALLKVVAKLEQIGRLYDAKCAELVALKASIAKAKT